MDDFLEKSEKLEKMIYEIAKQFSWKIISIIIKVLLKYYYHFEIS